MIKRKLFCLFFVFSVILSVLNFGAMPVFASTTGIITVAAANAYSYSVYLNGTYVGSGMGDGVDVKTFTLNLSSGQNAVSILHHRVSTLCDQTTGGIMADIEVNGTHYATDTSWKAMYVDYASMASNADYDVSSWPNAWSWGNPNLPGTVADMPAGTTAQWLWINDNNSTFPTFDRTFRFVFNVGGVTPPAPPTGSVKVQFYNTQTQTTGNTIYTRYKLINDGTTSVNLADVKFRYYFTNDGTANDNLFIDWSSINASNITSQFGTISKATADKYCELGFSAGAGTLAPGASVEIVGRIAKSDWSNFNQSNDYSFNSTGTSYSDWSKVTAYINGTLKWGSEP
ncbi:MAG TPA: cellulose binding domain-containing protein [Clostridia bacterium]